MEFGLHGLLVKYSNIATDIRIAAETGYDAIELHTDKLDRFLEAGLKGSDLKKLLDKNSLKVSCIDIIGDVEVQNPEIFEKVLDKAHTLVNLASEIDCKTIQLNGFSSLKDRSEAENISLTAKNIRQICNIGKRKGVQFQYEGAAWTPIHSLDQCLRLVEEVAEPNFGLVIDFWHFWSSRETNVDDLSKIDKRQILGVHVSDGFRPKIGAPWVDETLLRGALPGDGDLPVKRWIDAVKATGYDGFYSGEILCHKLWESDLWDISSETLKRMKKYF